MEARYVAQLDDIFILNINFSSFSSLLLMSRSARKHQQCCRILQFLAGVGAIEDIELPVFITGIAGLIFSSVSSEGVG